MLAYEPARRDASVDDVARPPEVAELRRGDPAVLTQGHGDHRRGRRTFVGSGTQRCAIANSDSPGGPDFMSLGGREAA